MRNKPSNPLSSIEKTKHQTWSVIFEDTLIITVVTVAIICCATILGRQIIGFINHHRQPITSSYSEYWNGL